eukprot:UN06650
MNLDWNHSYKNFDKKIINGSEIIKYMEIAGGLRDLKVVVFLYDVLKDNNLIDDRVKRILLNLHHKELVSKNNIDIPKHLLPPDIKRLKPKRRIHKICKGWLIADRTKKLKT